MDTTGDTATCSGCGAAIEYVGPHWRHVGEWKPRHEARPDGDGVGALPPLSAGSDSAEGESSAGPCLSDAATPVPVQALTAEREAQIRRWRATDPHPTHLHPDSVQAFVDSLLAEVDRQRQSLNLLNVRMADEAAYWKAQEAETNRLRAVLTAVQDRLVDFGERLA